MSDTRTDDQLPQTKTVFNQPALVFNNHQWQQQGYFLIDVCPNHTADCHTGGLPIPAGQMLHKDEKGYRLIDELTRL